MPSRRVAVMCASAHFNCDVVSTSSHSFLMFEPLQAFYLVVEHMLAIYFQGGRRRFFLFVGYPRSEPTVTVQLVCRGPTILMLNNADQLFAAEHLRAFRFMLSNCGQRFCFAVSYFHVEKLRAIMLLLNTSDQEF